jgi:hypothetical protein
VPPGACDVEKVQVYLLLRRHFEYRFLVLREIEEGNLRCLYEAIAARMRSRGKSFPSMVATHEALMIVGAYEDGCLECSGSAFHIAGHRSVRDGHVSVVGQGGLPEEAEKALVM